MLLSLYKLAKWRNIGLLLRQYFQPFSIKGKQTFGQNFQLSKDVPLLHL